MDVGSAVRAVASSRLAVSGDRLSEGEMQFPHEEGGGGLGLGTETGTAVLPTTTAVNFVENEGSSSADVVAQNIVINSNAGDHDHGSSKVKFKNIVDYNWEHKMYAGQLLAVHMDGTFLAYSIKAPQTSSGKSNGMVRITHIPTQKRSLIRGIPSLVQDLSFAFIASQTLLGCIDETGNIFIHQIGLQNEAIIHFLILHVVIPVTLGIEQRILWCPYVPDDTEDVDIESEDDSAKLVLVTQGNIAYIWNVGVLISRFSAGPLFLKDLNNCYLSIDDHTRPIVDAAFSPDGTSLATASYDGFVMFFQIYMNSDAPRCLYKWSPHDGKPLSCIFFLDNRSSTEQFWKFVVTGAEKNSVLKIWSCQSWVCLQTIIFAPSPKYPTIALKAGLDHSAKYLLLSDIHRKVLYILHFDTNSEDSAVYCKRVSEFHLPSPILCFGIVDTSFKRLKCPSTCSDDYHQHNIYHSPGESPDELKQLENDELCLDNELLSNGHEIDVNDNSNIQAVIRLYLIQPYRLQEGYITFSPLNSKNSMDKSLDFTNRADDTLEFKDGLTDISQMEDTSLVMTKIDSYVKNEDDRENNNENQQFNLLVQQSQQLKNVLIRPQVSQNDHQPGKQSTSPLISNSISNISYGSLLSNHPTSIQPPLNLMTPDAFSSAKHDEEIISVPEKLEIMCLPPAPILDSELKIINNQVNADIPTLVNSESLVSLPSDLRGFTNNQPQSGESKFTSGGSSPSREVQEILSVKESDFYEDEFEDLNEQNLQDEGQTPTVNSSLNQNKVSKEGFQIYSARRDRSSFLRAALGVNDTTNTTLSSINLPKTIEGNHCKSNTDGSDKSSTHSKSNLSTIIDLADADNILNMSSGFDKIDQNSKSSFSPIQNKDMKNILLKLDKLTGLISEQQKEMSVLRGEISMLKRISQNSIDDSNSVVKLIEQSLLRSQVQIKQIVDNAMDARSDSERSNREAVLSGLSQIIGAHIADKLNAAVTLEMHSTLVPLIERLLEPVITSMQFELSRKLTATDHLLSENIQKMVSSKSVIDSLCTAISHAVISSTKEAFKQTIQTSLIPHLEKAQSQMFKQLNVSFNSGTKEYLVAFENCTKRTIEHAGYIDETLSKVKSLTPQLQNIVEQQNKFNMNNAQAHQSIKQLHNMTKDLHNIISNSLQGVLDNQLTPIKECIKEQIRSGMAAQVAHLEDCVLSVVRTQTPAPSIIDTQSQQQHVENLLNTGQMNAAFQYALSASDLKLVVYACQAADLKQVFCSPCPLQPNVLLSLIQQLSADMTSDTQLKCSYLGEAVMYLDSENPLTKEHMPIVLKELQRQLSNFIKNNPNNTSSRQLKLLLLATESLLKS